MPEEPSTQGEKQHRLVVIPEVSSQPVEQLDDKVYSDGKLVYKLFGNLPEVIKKDELDALQRVRGIPGCQKLVRSDEAMIVTELAKGKRFRRAMDPLEAQVEALFRTLIAMRNVDVSFECEARNLLYETHNGFTVLDLQTDEKPQIPLLDLTLVFSDYQVDKSEVFLTEYNRLINSFFRVQPELARKTLKGDGKPWITDSEHLDNINHNSPVFKSLQSTLSSKFGINIQ